jgi:hypothetical protein
MVHRPNVQQLHEMFLDSPDLFTAVLDRSFGLAVEGLHVARDRSAPHLVAEVLALPSGLTGCEIALPWRGKTWSVNVRFKERAERFGR